jgi:hypothetical protein
MHRHVEILIGRLATDSALRRRFLAAPAKVLREQGLELTELELAAVLATDPAALRAFSAALDVRLRRVSTVGERASDGDSHPTHPPASGSNS